MSDEKSVEMTGAKSVPESTKSQTTPEVTISDGHMLAAESKPAVEVEKEDKKEEEKKPAEDKKPPIKVDDKIDPLNFDDLKKSIKDAIKYSNSYPIMKTLIASVPAGLNFVAGAAKWFTAGCCQDKTGMENGMDTMKKSWDILTIPAKQWQEDTNTGRLWANRHENKSKTKEEGETEFKIAKSAIPAGALSQQEEKLGELNITPEKVSGGGKSAAFTPTSQTSDDLPLIDHANPAVPKPPVTTPDPKPSDPKGNKPKP